jgi:hypothetical protein
MVLHSLVFLFVSPVSFFPPAPLFFQLAGDAPHISNQLQDNLIRNLCILSEECDWHRHAIALLELARVSRWGSSSHPERLFRLERLGAPRLHLGAQVVDLIQHLLYLKIIVVQAWPIPPSRGAGSSVRRRRIRRRCGMQARSLCWTAGRKLARCLHRLGELVLDVFHQAQAADLCKHTPSHSRKNMMNDAASVVKNHFRQFSISHDEC